MDQPSFPEWFCLKDGRKNFQIDPIRDKEHLFGEPIWEDDINQRLKRGQLLGTPVRLVWWGQYGIGKTHRLRHTSYLINSQNYKYKAVYVAATDLQDKTGFERLHFEIINALDREEMRKLVSRYLFKLKTDSSLPSLKELSRDCADVESALIGFGGDSVGLQLPSWRFLCGLELKGDDLIKAGFTKKSLDSSLEFAAAIGAFATIIQMETGCELLLLIDEMENLTKIVNKVAEAIWQESLRAILDLQNLSVVCAVGADRQESLPAIMVKPDIVRRFQKDNYVTMEAFKAPMAKSFVEGILNAWVDPDKRSNLETLENYSGTIADYKPSLYPFTAGAFERFCEWASVDQRNAKPSEIIARLNNIAAEAYFKKQRIINKDFLMSFGIA